MGRKRRVISNGSTHKRKKTEQMNFSVGDTILTKFNGCKVWWPAKVLRYNNAEDIWTVYISSDDAEFFVHENNMKHLDDLEVEMALATLKRKNMIVSFTNYAEDLKWLRGQGQSQEQLGGQGQSQEQLGGQGQSQEQQGGEGQSQEQLGGQGLSQEQLGGGQSQEQLGGQGQSQEQLGGQGQSQEQQGGEGQSQEQLGGGQSQEQLGGQGQSQEQLGGQGQSQEQLGGQGQSQEQLGGQGQSQEQLGGQAQSQEQLGGQAQEQLGGEGLSQEQLGGEGQSQEQLGGQGQSQEHLDGAGENLIVMTTELDRCWDSYDEWDMEDQAFDYTDSEYVPSEVEDSVTENSDCESEIFLYLGKLGNNNVDKDKIPSVLEVDIDGNPIETDEEIDEEHILRDIKRNGLYIKKVIKASTSKTGKRKKIDRVYNSYNYCSLCEVKVSNFAQHIARNREKHHSCKEVNDIQKEKDTKKKKTLLKLLRAKYNHEFNMNSLRKGKGEIFLERRPTTKFSVDEFGPCPNCYLWISKSLLQKHQEKCLAKGKAFNTSAEVTTVSDTIAERISPSVSKKLQEEVLEKMQMDEVGTVARNDQLIIQLGNQWMQKNIGNTLKRGTYTSQIMRLVSRLLINLRKIKPLKEEQSMWNYLKPEHLDIIIEAALWTAAPSKNDQDELEKPSNALKIGYDLKRLINGKIGLAILGKDKESRQDAEDLLKAVQIYWGTRVTKVARVILEQRHYTNEKALPDPEDIKVLNVHLKKSLESLDLNDRSYNNFQTVGEVVSAKLVMYNRRRTGELQAIKLADYHNRKTSGHGEILGQLSEFEKRLLESHELMTVRGKTGRGVPILLPTETKLALAFLTSPIVRKEAGVDSNIYVFAANGNSVIRAYDALSKQCNKANLKSPERITSTNLRKYMATITQVLDLKENEMQWVLNHMGHTLDIHKIHYRATSSAIERTQIAKILLLQDTDKVGQFSNKGLHEIQLDDIVMAANKTLTEQSSHEELEPFEEDDQNELLDFSEHLEAERPPSKKKSRQAAINAKGKWSHDEEREIRELLKSFFETNKRPSPKQIQKAINASKGNGGLLGACRKDVLKKKVFRMIEKNKKI